MTIRAIDRMRMVSIFVTLFLGCPAFAQMLPSFGFTRVAAPPNFYGAVAVGDFNDDGNLDIATGSCGSVQAGFGISLNTARSTDSIAFGGPILNPYPYCVQSIYVADVNRDSRLDAIVSADVEGKVTILLGQGNGTVKKGAEYSIQPTDATSYHWPKRLAVADFDGDGNPDFAVGNGSRMDIWLGWGDGTFRIGSSQDLLTVLPWLLVAGDFNKDGIQDLAAFCRPSHTPWISRVFVFDGHGDGTLAEPRRYEVAGDPSSAELLAADMNGDGEDDLILWMSGQTEVYLNHGDGTFSPSVSSVCFGCSAAVFAVAADIDADGRTDLISPNGGAGLSHWMHIMVGAGDGRFWSVLHFPSATLPGRIALGDFNGDRRLDMFAIPSSSGSPGEKATVWLGKSAPHLVVSVTQDRPVYNDEPTMPFTVRIGNAPGAEPLSAPVVVEVINSEGLPERTEEGWTCGYESSSYLLHLCRRSDVLGPGENYPPIHFVVETPRFLDYSTSYVRIKISGGGFVPVDAVGTVSVIPNAQTCMLAVSPYPSLSVSASGGRVETRGIGTTGMGGGCPVTVTPKTDWIHPVDIFTYEIEPNQTGAQRIGEIEFSSLVGWKRTLRIEQSAEGCVYDVSVNNSVLAAVNDNGGGVFVSVSTGPGCTWNASSNVNWLANPYIAPFGAFFTLETNPDSKPRMGTVTVAGKAVSVFQCGTADPVCVYSRPVTASLAHYATGAGWDATIHVVNTRNTPALTPGGFYTDSGFETTLPMLDEDENKGTASPLRDRFLMPYGSRVLHTSYADSSLRAHTGSVQTSFDAGVDAFIRFSYVPNGQEALVPMETRNAAAYSFGFDNTNGYAAGVAVANVSGQSATIPVKIRDDAGSVLVSDTISLPENGQTSFVLNQQFPATTNKGGSIEFGTPAGGRISVLGIRASSQLQFTSIPVVASDDPGSGSLGQFVSGGGWTTTIEVLNTADVPKEARLTLFQDNGERFVAPLRIVQTGVVQNVSEIVETIPAHGRMVVETVVDSGFPAQGWAQLLSTVGVSAVVRFQYNSTGQESVVPLEARNAPAYQLAFDNRGGLATGVAVANLASVAATVSVVIRDRDGAQIGTGTVTLPPQGHTAFMLVDRFSSAVNRAGTVEFGTPLGGRIGVLGLRATPAGALVTIPVMAP